MFREAVRSKGNTGIKLLELLERRLDNVVFRAGFARSIPAARQLVNHGHVLVNGRRVDISSFRVKVGHTIVVKPGSAQSQVVTLGLALAEQRRWDTSWLTVNVEERSAVMARLPDEHAVPFAVDAQLVIELYAMSA